ncbi:MAG TPA: polysaccharide biosynthesis/export family protein [Acidobacteriota bacterium]|nr:polysaccharide biosynthesis/export family protein [Acidobacteriota bacterium]
MTARVTTCFTLLALFVFSIAAASARQGAHDQDNERKRIPITVDDIMRFQTAGDRITESSDLNERLLAMSAASRYRHDYLLGPGDIVEVTVFGIPDLQKKSLTLDSEGRISLPFINQVNLMGLTARESEVKIATLLENSVMKNPQVSVSVSEHRSQFFNVMGAVFKPGTYQITRKMFLIDALAMAGGLLAEKSEQRVNIHRTAPDMAAADTAAGFSPADFPKIPTTIEIDLHQLLEKGDVRLNVPIYAGDVISVPERIDRYFYVIGDVNRSGAFEIQPGETITLTRALAAAGGLLSTARTKDTMVIRQNADGATTQIPVDARKLLRGEIPDIELARNDLVVVPGSTTRAIAKGALSGIGGILAALIVYGLQ